ncbi:MAG: hypothetical protein U0930_17585 [Pirellulales bacterium]
MMQPAPMTNLTAQSFSASPAANAVVTPEVTAASKTTSAETSQLVEFQQ